MDLNNHIVKNNDNKHFHSSGFAQVAVGNRLGSVSAESFNKRLQTDLNRQLIKGYNRSLVGSSYATLRAQSIQPGSTIRPSINSPKKHFSEPPTRSYNPYA